MTTRFNKKIKVLATAAVLAANLVLGQVLPVSAALTEVSTVNPTTGFPVWYKDSNGLTLDLMEAADGFGISAPVEAGNQFSQQIGFGAEGFWWSAEADIATTNTITGLPVTGILVMAQEAAFAGETAVNGEQSAFQRMRLRIDGLQANQSYTINHPYGSVNLTADAAGTINETQDVGCFAGLGITCNQPTAPNFSTSLAQNVVNAPLGGTIGPFLTWDTFNPAAQDPALINPANPGRIYVGNPLTAHTVTGGTNGNVLSVSGPGVNFTQAQFTVTGRVAQIAPTITVNTQTATTATPTITGTVSDATATVTVVVNAQTPVTATVNPDGTWTATVGTLANGTYEVAATATTANGTGTDTTTNELTVNVAGQPPVNPPVNPPVTPTAPQATGPVVITDKGFATINKNGGLFITHTNVPSTLKVFFGTSKKKMKAQVSDGATSTNHEINFTTLRPGKTYYVKSVVQGTDGSEAQTAIIKVKMPRR